MSVRVASCRRFVVSHHTKRYRRTLPTNATDELAHAYTTEGADGVQSVANYPIPTTSDQYAVTEISLENGKPLLLVGIKR